MIRVTKNYLTKEQCQNIINSFHTWERDYIKKTSIIRKPQPPFTTSTLQQEASRKLNFGASRTMQLAQRLYEGIEMGGDTVGLILSLIHI